MIRARLIIAASEWRERRIRRAAERVLGAPCECGEARIGEAHDCAIEPRTGPTTFEVEIEQGGMSDAIARDIASLWERRNESTYARDLLHTRLRELRLSRRSHRLVKSLILLPPPRDEALARAFWCEEPAPHCKVCGDLGTVMVPGHPGEPPHEVACSCAEEDARC